MQSKLDQYIDFIGGQLIVPQSMRWLRHGLYLVVAYNILCLSLPIHDLLWGTHSLVMPFNFADIPTHKAVMYLHDTAHAGWYPFFMALPVIGILIYMLWGLRRLSAILVYIGTVILYSRVYLYLTGGGYLLHILLFFLMFMDEGNAVDTKRGVVSVVLSNFALLAVRVQVIIVYVFSGLYKLAGELWRSGEAVYLITHVDEYTLPWFEHSVANIHWLMVIANYASLAYFFLFPILVWSKRFKLSILCFGFLLHLGMGLVLGVMDFSLVMIVTYAAFLDPESIAKLRAILPSKKRSVAHP